jgi:hypothetical protein
LERDRKQRLRDIGEARIVIGEPEEEPVRPTLPVRPWLVATALALGLAVAAVGWWHAAQPAPLSPFDAGQH